jgi:hypothetical protein
LQQETPGTIPGVSLNLRQTSVRLAYPMCLFSAWLMASFGL